MAGVATEAAAEKPIPAGLPSAGARGVPRMQGTHAYQQVWNRHFGQGLDIRMLEGQDFTAPIMMHRERRVLELGTRFDFIPADRAFIQHARRRYLPLRQAAPPISIEAGNLRGGFADAGPAGADALLQSLADMRGWDYALLPIPADTSPRWVAAVRKAGLLPILRQTGRIYFSTPDFAGWDALIDNASRNFRKNINKMQRTVDEGGVTLNLYQGADLPRGLDHLRACAEDSWKAQDDARDVPVLVPLTDRQLAFFADLDTLDGHRLLIATMEKDGRPLAVQLWVAGGPAQELMGGITYHIATSRPFAPGHALMKFMLEWAGNAGIRAIDFNATDPWLAAYASHATPFNNLLVMRNTVWGRLLHKIARRFDPGLPVPLSEAA